MKLLADRSDRCTISAVFDTREAVDDALVRLELLGMPRDLVDVAVSEAVAQRVYGGHARRHGSRAVALAALGALVGLLVGIAVSLVAVAWPGQALPRAAFVAQLLGPNAGSALGAVVGGVVGAFLSRPPDETVGRALDVDGVVLAVRRWPVTDAARIVDTLRDGGGHDVRVVPGAPA